MRDQQWHSNHNLYLGHSLWGLNTSILQTALVPTAFIKKTHLNICSLSYTVQSNSNFTKRCLFAFPLICFFILNIFGTRLAWYLKHKIKFGSTQNVYPILINHLLASKKKKFQYTLNSILQVNWNARERCVWTWKYILRQTIKVRLGFIWDFSKCSHLLIFAFLHCFWFLGFIHHRQQKYQIVIIIFPPRSMKSKKKNPQTVSKKCHLYLAISASHHSHSSFSDRGIVLAECRNHFTKPDNKELDLRGESPSEVLETECVLLY